MAKELKVNVPEGYEIDKENSTFECIKFKPIEKELPKTWKEFCETHDIHGECFLARDGFYCLPTGHEGKRRLSDKGYLPNKKTAKAMLALCQLIQLRDCYNNGWKPDWRDESEIKYNLYTYGGEVSTNCITCPNRILVFKTPELRDKFLENFRDLIETAKSLL